MLLESGHKVTIFDKNKDLGGMVDSVIPTDRQSVALRNEMSAIFKDVSGDRLKIESGTVLNEKCNLNNQKYMRAERVLLFDFSISLTI